MNLKRNPRSGIMLLECVVYMAVLFLVLTLTYQLFYEHFDHFRGVNRNAEDISRALRAGELWRADLRAATGAPVLTEDNGAFTLVIPRAAGPVTYRWRKNSIWRQPFEGAPWGCILSRVRTSTLQAERRSQVTAWRWEVELATQRKEHRITPLFTFLATTPEAKP